MGDFRRGPRQRKEWVGSGANQVNLTTGGQVTILATLPFVGAGTILRCLGQLTVGVTAASTAGDQAVIFLGLGIISSDAAELGSTAVPDPGVEFEFPWLWWYSVPIHTPTTSVGGYAGEGERVTFDSRSMRKFKPRESLVLIAQYVDLVGLPPLTVGIGGLRVLVGQ